MTWRLFEANHDTYTEPRHITVSCERCKRDVSIHVSEFPLATPVTCSDCQSFLASHPDIAEREFQKALRRSEEDSRQMRARWAAQDVAKHGRTA